MKEADKRGEMMNLSEEEIAFYDALEVNDSAVKVLGDVVLCEIARDLVISIRKNVSIDWTVERKCSGQAASHGKTHTQAS